MRNEQSGDADGPPTPRASGAVAIEGRIRSLIEVCNAQMRRSQGSCDPHATPIAIGGRTYAALDVYVILHHVAPELCDGMWVEKPCG